MADLDGDLQGGTAGVAPSAGSFVASFTDLDGDIQGSNFKLAANAASSVEDHIQLDGDIQGPKSGGFESDSSSCSCVQGAPFIHTVSIVAAPNQLTVTFSDDVVLSGPALDLESWFVTLTGLGKEVRITSLLVVGQTVVLGTTPQTLNATYRLHLPTVGITSPTFGVFTGLYSLDFLGVPTIVTIQMVRAVDTHHLDVIFSVAVEDADASDPANYSVDNGIVITEAVRITDFWYRLRNDPRQTDGVTYTFIVTNINAK